MGIEEANVTAIKAELPLPDFSGVMQECWEQKLNFTMEEMKKSAQGGSVTSTLSLIEAANEAAMNAGRPLPDSSRVMQECWEKRLVVTMEAVNTFAQRGFDRPTLSHIEKANEAATNAGRPLPDFSGVMRECWEKKLDLATENVRTFARQGWDTAVQFWAEIANDAALKAGYRQPDWTEATQQLMQNKRQNIAVKLSQATP
jgi:hypothetical protein